MLPAGRPRSFPASQEPIWIWHWVGQMWYMQPSSPARRVGGFSPAGGDWLISGESSRPSRLRKTPPQGSMPDRLTTDRARSVDTTLEARKRQGETRDRKSAE